MLKQMSLFSSEAVNISSTLQNAEDRDIQNDVASFLCECKTWFLTVREVAAT